MSGLPKEFLLQEVARLENEIANTPAPREVEVLVPAIGLLVPGETPPPNPYSVQSGKVYVIEYLTEDYTLQLPPGSAIEPGFSFEAVVAYLEVLGPYHVRVAHAPGRRSLMLGDVTTSGGGVGAGPEAPLTMGGQAGWRRFTYLGPLIVPSEQPIDLWTTMNLNALDGGLLRQAELATTAALPSYTSSGEGGEQVLTAVSGTLTVDGQGVTVTGHENLILVKDESTGSLNGLYHCIQENPWKLLRASSDQSNWQRDDHGMVVYVREGTANANKLFGTERHDSPWNELGGGGGGGGVADFIYDNTLETTDTSWHNISSHTPPDLRAVHVRATVWFWTSGTSSMCKWVMEASVDRYAYTGTNLRDLTYMYVHKDNSPGSWDAADADIAISGTAFVVRVKAPNTNTYRWRCQLEVSEHG